MMKDKTKRTMNKTDVWSEIKPVAQMANHYNDWLSQCIVGQTLQRLYEKMTKRTDSVLSVRLTDEINGCADDWRVYLPMIQPV